MTLQSQLNPQNITCVLYSFFFSIFHNEREQWKNSRLSSGSKDNQANTKIFTQFFVYFNSLTCVDTNSQDKRREKLEQKNLKY